LRRERRTVCGERLPRSARSSFGWIPWSAAALWSPVDDRGGSRGGAWPCRKSLWRVAEFESELVLHRGAQDAAQAAAVVAVMGDGLSVVAADGVGEAPEKGAVVVGRLPGRG
jgi:hypothetical protein